MAGPVLNIAFVFPYQEMAAGFVDASQKIQDLRKPMGQAATDFERDMKDQFMKQGRQAGGWARLAPITQEIRRQEGYGATSPILRRTGALMKSFSQKGAKGHIREIRKMGFTAGSEVKVSWAGKTWNLGHIHDEGFSQTVTELQSGYFGWKWRIPLNEGTELEMPARKIIWVSPAAIKRMMARIHTYVIDVLGDEFKGLVYVRGRQP